MKNYVVLFFCAFVFSGLFGQKALRIPTNVQPTYEKGIRDFKGKPGKAYWQNFAQYDIEFKLNTKDGIVRGHEEVIYENHSPDTLKEIVFSIFADINKKTNNHDFNIPKSLLNEGVTVSKISLNNQVISTEDESVVRQGTNMTLKLANPLPPKSEINVQLDWSYELLKGLTLRGGNYGDSVYFISYAYPKIAVYDAIDGWDKNNYTGYTEFYGQFADYNVAIEVPANWPVWATGELQNAKEILNPKYYKRWKKAKQSETVIQIIDSTDITRADLTKGGDLVNWHFKAKNVPDFAFSTGYQFLWDGRIVEVDSKSKRKAFVDAGYRKTSKDYYDMANIASMALYNYSTDMPGVPYPYPCMTVFNGNDGMEYPMMCNDVSTNSKMSSVTLAYHEIAHSYFPFYMGTNERKYAWMDEGWASFFPALQLEKHELSFKEYFDSRKNRYFRAGGKEVEVPILTLSTLLRTRTPYRQASYNKPFFAYYYLYELMGKEAFQNTLKGFMNRWEGKHPIPYDFFLSFNDLSQSDLNWYWFAWFYENNYADLSLTQAFGNGIVVRNKGGLPLPIELKIKMKNGELKYEHRNCAIWSDGRESVFIRLDDMKNIESITLGGDFILDVNESDNFLKL